MANPSRASRRPKARVRAVLPARRSSEQMYRIVMYWTRSEKVLIGRQLHDVPAIIGHEDPARQVDDVALAAVGPVDPARDVGILDELLPGLRDEHVLGANELDPHRYVQPSASSPQAH